MSTHDIASRLDQLYLLVRMGKASPEDRIELSELLDKFRSVPEAK